MKNILKTLALVAIGVAVGRAYKKKGKPTNTVTIRIKDLKGCKNKIKEINEMIETFKSREGKINYRI